MFVEKIEIPAFRVLRDVGLDFTGGYDPHVSRLIGDLSDTKRTLAYLDVRTIVNEL